MEHYTAYGFDIRSELSLPELIPIHTADAHAQADVVIRYGTIDHERISMDTWPAVTKIHVWLSGDEFCISHIEAGSFLVRQGREIIIDPSPGADERILRLFVLGAVFGVLLQQRGFFALHASVIAFDGNAIAVCGESGSGKSTLASALYANGHRIVADDIAAVQVDGHQAVVTPGFPQLKLWPNSVAALGEDPQGLPQLDPRSEKRARRVADRFHAQALPLQRIYVLDEGDEPRLETLPHQAGLLALIRHSFAPFPLMDTSRRSIHFRQCATLAHTLPIRRFSRPHDFRQLHQLAQMIEDDIGRHSLI